jgi:hypothetical protein
MAQNVVETGLQMTILPRLRSCTHTHKHTQKYVRLIAFQRQQRFRGRVSLLRYAYIVCLVIPKKEKQLCPLRVWYYFYLQGDSGLVIFLLNDSWLNWRFLTKSDLTLRPCDILTWEKHQYRLWNCGGGFTLLLFVYLCICRIKKKYGGLAIIWIFCFRFAGNYADCSWTNLSIVHENFYLCRQSQAITSVLCENTLKNKVRKVPCG